MIDKPVVSLVRKELEIRLRDHLQQIMNEAITLTLEDVQENLLVRFKPVGDGNFTVEFTWRPPGERVILG